MLRVTHALFTATVLLFGLKAFAAQPLVAISPNDPTYGFYENVLNQNSTGVVYDTDGLFNEACDICSPVQGRIVTLRNGEVHNPENLVLSVNDQLYLIDTGLEQIRQPYTLLRRLTGPNSGIFLLIEGIRVGEIPTEKVAVRIRVKIATFDGQTLQRLQYSEDHGGE